MSSLWGLLGIGLLILLVVSRGDLFYLLLGYFIALMDSPYVHIYVYISICMYMCIMNIYRSLPIHRLFSIRPSIQLHPILTCGFRCYQKESE